MSPRLNNDAGNIGWPGGGELFDRILERGSLSEDDVADAVRSILKGVSYLHSHAIVHRDLKVCNVSV